MLPNNNNSNGRTAGPTMKAIAAELLRRDALRRARDARYRAHKKEKEKAARRREAVA